MLASPVTNPSEPTSHSNTIETTREANSFNSVGSTPLRDELSYAAQATTGISTTSTPLKDEPLNSDQRYTSTPSKNCTAQSPAIHIPDGCYSGHVRHKDGSNISKSAPPHQFMGCPTHESFLVTLNPPH